ncbi:hypothetical protein J3R30DRAFT_3282917 [Lentinula aciculospora]|uniref:DUF1793-domain-containing protein n=1 Tax=Lentinula aciculospora TaxID=153920 RepID=A0A9W9DUX2_9AGAR|nr:hypothetical protein J3R30DRAFT_3282917 [Lentinula aciculospora]
MLIILVLSFVILLVQCQSIQPAAIPLAVRSPYLQAYLGHNSGAAVPNSWPVFWTNHIVGWSGLMRVDGALYEWLGGAIEGPDLRLANNATAKAAKLIGVQIKPTRSILSLQAGPMAINVTFLSPIERSNLVLQSFPFTYVYMNLSSTDGNPHSIQLYEDITGEWTSFDLNSEVQWNTTVSESIIYHQIHRSPPQYMTEQDNMASDPVVYHVTNVASTVTFQSGSDLDVRSQFLNNGSLNNTQDTDFRAIGVSWPVLAFCNDLGNITSTSSPVVWGIGLVRDGNIISSGNQTRRPYFFTKYQDSSSALTDLMNDSSNALQRAIALDDQIVSAATAISPNYVDLVSLASRQVMAGMEITVGSGADGELNASDIQFFMKDMGNSQRVNPVEVLYASLPAFLYFNASWTRYLLEPLMQFEQSDLYTLPFASEDLGDAFPSAVGNTSPAVFTAIESISDMIFMVWAHATSTQDGSLIAQYYSTLKKWTDTLISENPLFPNGFISADGLADSNMTNLAIKGILAIRTMAQISNTLGNMDDHDTYLSSASSLVSQWQTVAQSSGHITSTYGASSSWSLMYNLYPDKLFGFNLVDESIYTAQSAWYASVASNAPPFGLGFDTLNESTAKSHWTLFTAGIVNDNVTRDLLISMVHASAANLNAFTVFPTTYNNANGSTLGGAARHVLPPAQGAMFALLALNFQIDNSSTPQSTSTSVPTRPNINSGAIAGGVVGGVVFVAFSLLAIFLYCRRSKSGSEKKDNQIYESIMPYPLGLDFRIDLERERNPIQVEETVHITQPPFTSKRLVTTEVGTAIIPTASDSAVASSDAGVEEVLLREEVENLRREMEEMKLRIAYEPLPGYQ